VIRVKPHRCREYLRRGACGLVVALAVTASAGEAPAVLQLLRSPNGVVIALTNQEGGLYLSRDEGRSWDSLAAGLPSGRLFSVAASETGRLWACTYEGVYWSDDSGLSWSEASLPGLALFVMPDALLARTLPRGLALSADDGASWSAVGGGMEPLHVTAAMRAQNGDIWLGAFGTGVHRSTDGGRSWRSESDGLANRDVLALGSGADGSLLVGAFRGGAYRREAGDVWRPVAGLPEEASPQAFIADGTTLAAATHGHGMFLSEDAGRTWRQIGGEHAPTRVTTLLPVDRGWLVGSLDGGLVRLNTRTSAWTRVSLRHDVTALHRTSGGDLFAGLGDGRLLHSKDGHVAWQDVSPLPGAVQAVLRTRDGRLLAGTPAGAFASDDDGATWATVAAPVGNANVLAWGETSSGSLLAGTDAGLYRTDNGGRSWREAALPTEPQYFYDLAVGPDAACYAATEHGFARSDDQGQSWSEEYFIYGLRNVLAIADGGVTVAHRNGLFRSEGPGREFEEQEVRGAEGVIIHHWDHPVALPDGSLLMADTSGVVRMTPAGPGAWQIAARSLAHADVRDLAVLPGGTVLAATDKGLFMSRDSATTWVQVGLP